MAVGRNWLTTLHPASFKGVPFETEGDDEGGGRRIVSHEFPMRDDPFNEDLGEAKREFDVTAYLASDQADSDATAFVSVLTQRGPGLLVLPTHGQLLVRCHTFKRDRKKDQAGKIGFALKFVREGAASSLVSFASLANLVFARADTVVSALAGWAEGAITAFRQADFVIASATSALQDGAAALETLRTTEAVDPAVSATQRDAIQRLFDAAPAAVQRDGTISGDAVASVVTIARTLGDGLASERAVPAFEQMLDPFVFHPAAVYLTASARAADQNRAAVYLAIRVAAVTAYAEAVAKAPLADRQAAITLRANVAEHFEAILEGLSAADFAFFQAIVSLRGAVIDYLSRAILDRAPIIKVGANLHLPSLWWAHRLYQNPLRATEIAARNRVIHPSFMPIEFEALSR